MPRAATAAIVATCCCLAIGASAAPEGEAYFFTPAGFAREGKPATASGKDVGRVRIIVTDRDTGKPTCCRVNVIGPDGNFYQPETNHLSPYSLTGEWPKAGAWGNRPEKAPYRYVGRFFYTWGEATTAVPAGSVRVEVWKGLEYTPQSVSTKLTAGETRDVRLTLTRAVPMTEHGYYSGDPHLHFPRESERDEETILDLLEAEDIRAGFVLGYNEPAGPYSGLMNKMAAPQRRGLGRQSVRQRGGYGIFSGQEYRSTTYGHLNLYLRGGLLFPGQNLNANNWPVYGDIGRETLSAGGIAIPAHGGYAQEIYADVAQGAVSAVELLQFGVYRGIGLEDWYHILNSGYRFPCVAGSDYPACRTLGDCRTYVEARRSTRATPLAPPDWLRAAAGGRSFVTTGPLILLEVDGEKPGAIVRKSSVTARVRVRCEVTPVTNVELIVNGQTAERLNVSADDGRGKWLDLTKSLKLTESSWIAARAYSTTPGGRPDAEAHTNPVYVYINGRAPYRSASLDAWLAKLDALILTTQLRPAFAEKSRVLNYFQRSRDLLLKIRADGGLAADADPIALARTLNAASPSGRDLAADASLPDATEAELKEFLKPVPPKTPAEALKTFETVDGFHMELVAAEPLVYNPVAAAFDEDGNLYVCELRDYPYKPQPGKQPIGRVRLLRDTKGTGIYDESHVFADNLQWPAGIVPWKGGVFVASCPDIWYLKDTDGDGKADVRRKVYTGFGSENPQGIFNNLQFWLDHKIYGTTSGNGGEVRHVDRPEYSPVSVRGRDFRFDPSGGSFESITGTHQFGNTFDDWGNRFLCNESKPLTHVVLPQEYLARNPFLAVPDALHNLAPAPVPVFRISPIERWRQIRSSRRVAQNIRTPTGAGVSHGVVDAGAGATVYRGGAYPAKYYGTVFVGDGQNNLVHHRALIPDGVTFKSQRVEQNTEFVRSSDIWFRPVNFVNAPDGTLYCLDLSREVLEAIHIPLDVVKHLDLTSGRDSGRIYRMAPPNFKSPPPPRLSRASTAELVAALESPHGWWRDTAHRLLYERQDNSAVPALERLAEQGKSAQARLHALWSLHGLVALSERVLSHGLADEAAGVREHAVRLAESWLDKSPALLDKVLSLANDADARVRFQVAFTLGETKDPRAAAALADLARRDANDVWMRTAVLSSIAESADGVLISLLKDATFAAGPGAAMVEQMATVVGARNRPAEVDRVLDAIAASPSADLRRRLVLDLGSGLPRGGGRLPIAGSHERMIQDLIEQARKTATDSAASESQRRPAVQLLGCAPFSLVRETLAGLLDPRQPPAVQTAAVRALGDYADSAVAELLLAKWPQCSPEVRQQAIAALLAREDRALALLRAAERNEADVGQLDLTQRELLRTHRSEAIRTLAGKLFGPQAVTVRSSVIDDYKPALRLAGDLKRGEKVFEANCAACHRLGDKGHAVGPELASAATKDPESILTDILDPNRFVPPNYVQYVVTDKRGRVFTGVIAGQTATSLTLRRQQGEADTILRGDIDELTSTGKSLMPEGLEKSIDKQAMADLLAYVRDAAAREGESIRVRDFGTLPGLIEPDRR
jgi:putative membrane-bound dehydrogenase-like protein